MIKESSQRGYTSIFPKIKTQFDIILSIMDEGKLYTRRELHHFTGFETATVSARVNQLVKEGKLKICGDKKDPYTGIVVEALTKSDPTQLKLI